jgi:thiol-disulfide isomerase/thioredoxin
VLEGSGPIVVEFMSYGCVHCRMMEPVLQQAAEALEATERVMRVNVAVDADLANRYGVEGTPTLVMFLDGQEIARAVGPQPVLESLMTVLTQPFA